jgi:hypothetical protein
MTRYDVERAEEVDRRSGRQARVRSAGAGPETTAAAPPPAGSPHALVRLQRQVGNAGTVAALTGARGRGASAPAAGQIVVSRLKEPPSPFRGAAATADVRAAESGSEAGGVAPITVSQEYAQQQAERKEQQMDSFRHEDIPFVSENQDHYAYKKLIELRQEYIDDGPRISLAQGAFNDFVVPGTMAVKSAAQFARVQQELGYYDEADPTEDFTAKERRTLAKGIDEGQLRTLNEVVANKAVTTQGLRKEILSTSHTAQAALQKRAGVLALDAKAAGEAQKQAIDDKIKAVKGAFETAGEVVGAVSFAGFGGPALATEIMAGGSGAVKGGLEVAGMGTSLVGSTVEFIMTEMYKEQIEKAKQQVEKAKVAEAHARQMDAELSMDASMLAISGQLDQLQGAMGDLAVALRARKDYFATLGIAVDKASGNKAGGKMSQYLAYVSQAHESKAHIASALSAAESGAGVMQTQVSAMARHRTYAYVADRYGVWDDRARKRDGEGPDLAQLRAALETLRTFQTAAKARLAVIDSVIGSMPTAE